MENMVNLFKKIYKNKTVLVTGHTGFKGSWLIFWLEKLGANVIGFSLPPEKEKNHYCLINKNIISIFGDIRNKEEIKQIIEKYKPEFIFHLAAQALVKKSYNFTVETLETNIIGTANIFEACRNKNFVKVFINVTSDKCYENKEWVWGYRENETMGGYDPYSVSKACSELITNSYRNSFFNLKEYRKTHNLLIASMRAGNVIGGGDWAEDRLIPDIVKSIINNKPVIIRNPNSTRPWQHVLEPLSAYLLLGQKLYEKEINFSQAWNVGDLNNSVVSVKDLLKILKKSWQELKFEIQEKNISQHEAKLLNLDCSKIYYKLAWFKIWDTETTIEKTINWYKSYFKNKEIETEKNLNAYVNSAKKLNAIWTL